MCACVHVRARTHTHRHPKHTDVQVNGAPSPQVKGHTFLILIPPQQCSEVFLSMPTTDVDWDTHAQQCSYQISKTSEGERREV